MLGNLKTVYTMDREVIPGPMERSILVNGMMMKEMDKEP